MVGIGAVDEFCCVGDAKSGKEVGEEGKERRGLGEWITERGCRRGVVSCKEAADGDARDRKARALVSKTVDRSV